MTKYKTSFDKSFRNEEQEILIDNIIDKRSGGTRMLLRAYNTEIFEPRPEDLSSVTSEEFNQFLKKAENLRGKKVKKKYISVCFRHVMACAASLAVIIVLAVLYTIDGQNSGTDITRNNPPNIGAFRGQNGSEPVQQLAPTTSGQVSHRKTNQEPLAYLVDVNGEVLIKRENISVKAESSCQVLYTGDIVSLENKSTAKIMYVDSFFDICGANEYQIASSSPLKVGAGNNRQVVQPSFTTRGAGYVNPVNTIAIAPKILIAQIAAPITRAAGDYINVYSPHGASLSNTPKIFIGGDDKEIYTVSVLDLLGNTYGKAIQLKGKSSVPWKEISEEPLQPEEIYSIKVTLNNKIVNDANNASFWFVSEEEAKIRDVIKRFDNLESSEARDFFKANALYMNGCYAEAYAIALKLDHKKQIYANLVKLCNKALEGK